MGKHDSLERKGAEIFRAGVIAFLSRGQQRMQHFDRRLEHFDEFEQALRRPVEAARIAVGVRVVLREMLELADVDLADEGRDVLVVLVAGLGLGDADLAQLGGIELDDGEPERSPSKASRRLAAQGEQTPVSRRSDAVAALEDRAHGLRAEKAERRFEHRADLVAGHERIDRLGLHQRLEALGQRGLAAADRTEEIEDLLALLEPLRGVLEIAHHPLDRLLHAEESGQRRVELDRAIEENAAEARVLCGVDDNRLADGGDHPLGGACRHARIVAATLEIVGQAHRLSPFAGIGRREEVEDVCLALLRARRCLPDFSPRECKTCVQAHEVPPIGLSSVHTRFRSVIRKG